MSDLTEKAIRPAFLIGLAAIALVSVVVLPDGGYQFAHFPKILTLQICAVAISVCMCIASFGRAGRNLPLPVSVFLLLSTVQLSRSLNPHEATLPLLVLAGSIAVAFGTAAALDETRRLMLTRWVSVVAGGVCLVGVLESLDIQWAQLRSAGRPSATLGFRNTAATFATGALPWCVYLSTRRLPRDRAVGALTSAVVLLFIVFTRSRGAWSGCLVASAAACAWWFWRGRKAEGYSLSARSAVFSVVVVVCVLFVGSRSPSFKDVSPSRLDESKQSIQATVRSLTTPGGDRDRWAIWSHTIEMILEKPISGVGLGNWSAHYPRYDRGDVLHINSAPRRPHNDFLWIASELGLPALAVFIWCLYTAGLAAFSRHEMWRVAAACSMIAIVTHSLFSFSREQAAPSLLLWAGIAVCLSGIPDRRGLRPVLIWPMLLIACLVGTTVAVKALVFDAHYGEALAAQRAGDSQRQLKAAGRALQSGPFDHRVFLLRGDVQLSSGNYREAIETHIRYSTAQPYLPAVNNNLGHALNAVGDYSAAEHVLRKGREVLGDDRLLVNNLAETLRRQGHEQEALSLYTGLSDLTADEHQNLGVLYAEADSLEQAIAHYGAAIQMDPTLTEPIYSVAGIQLIQGDLDAAIRGYETYLKTPSPNPTLIRRSKARLRQAYTSLGVRQMELDDAKGAVDALERREQLGEMTASESHNLALAYGRSGAFDLAIEAARRAVTMDPTLVIARLALANALYEHRDPESFEHYAVFVREWQGEPRLLQIAQRRLKRQKP